MMKDEIAISASEASEVEIPTGDVATDNWRSSDNRKTQSDDGIPHNNSGDDVEASSSSRKLPWYKFEGVDIAQGYNLAGMGRGALVMSNIFLSTSFVYLASLDAGCVDKEGDITEDCDAKVYGFKPVSFVSNIAVTSGVISALFMPVIGAIVDYTEHRRLVGILSATLMIMIQVIQIGTVLSTWFPMAILQAINGFLYQVQVVAIYAYLPDMSYVVGEKTMTRFTATFSITQFFSQASFLVAVIAISMILRLNDVVTAQVNQGIDSLWSGVLFLLAWRLMAHVPPKHSLPEGRSLLTQGFVQVYRTAKNINLKYRKGLRWYFLALIAAEAGANSFTTVAVVFLGAQVGMSGTEIGIFFLVTLLATIPGSWIASSLITPRLDPKRSWQCCMIVMALWTAVGVIVVSLTPTFSVYLWGFGIGALLGWFYPTQNLFFSMILPKGQETELSGFFVYCTQILGWLPPLIFTTIVEADVSQTYGVIAVSAFFPIACVILMFAAPWNDILKESGRLGSDEGNSVVEETSHDVEETNIITHSEDILVENAPQENVTENKVEESSRQPRYVDDDNERSRTRLESSKSLTELIKE